MQFALAAVGLDPVGCSGVVMPPFNYLLQAEWGGEKYDADCWRAAAVAVLPATA